MSPVRILRLFLLIIPWAAAFPLAAGSPRDGALDWSSIAEEAAARQIPIAILFTALDCGYCERLLTEVIRPGFSGGQLTGRALVREIALDGGGKLRDFDGELIRIPLFGKRYQVHVAPTLVLVDPRGEPLVPAVVGYSADSGTYEADLAQALIQATTRLRVADPEGS